MKQIKPMLAAASGLALVLTLAACGDDNVEEADETATMTETETLAVVDVDPLARTYTLTPEQQAARDAYDVEALQTEYRGYYDEIRASAGTTGTTSTTATAGSTADSGSTTSGSQQAGATASAGRMDRSSMDFSYLDRNGDGQLSVAEFAIWAVPVDPNAPKPNDETKPYLTADQANSAADAFFYYDQNGDTYLSQQEFDSARSGETRT